MRWRRSSPGYKPQFPCLVVDGDAEVVADPCHVVDCLTLVRHPPSVVSLDVVVMHLRPLERAQIIPLSPCFSICKANDLRLGKTRCSRSRSTTGQECDQESGNVIAQHLTRRSSATALGARLRSN